MCNKEIISSGIYITKFQLNGDFFLHSLFSHSRQGQNIFSFYYVGKKGILLPLPNGAIDNYSYWRAMNY